MEWTLGSRTCFVHIVSVLFQVFPSGANVHLPPPCLYPGQSGEKMDPFTFCVRRDQTCLPVQRQLSSRVPKSTMCWMF